MTRIKSQTQCVDDIDALYKRVEKPELFDTSYREGVILHSNRLTDNMTYA